MKKYLFFISIILLSCQEEITLDLPRGDNKLVVQGAIENGFPPYVILTNNQGYFEPIDSDTYANLFVTDVDSIKVWYIDENGFKISKSLGMLPPEFAEEITGEPIPLYTIADLSELSAVISNPGNYNFSQAGRTYYLEIKWNNQIISAQTTIPTPTPLDCLWVEQNETADKDYKCDIRALYSDPADQQNNILIKSKRIAHYKRVGEHTDSIQCEITNQPDTILKLVDAGSDVLINGESFETYFPRPGDNGFPTGKYNSAHSKDCNDTLVEFKNDVVLIKFCQIDEPSMKFWRGLVRQVGTNGNPFAEPMNLVSNINGGLGVFTGYGAVYYKVPIIKETTIDQEYLPGIIDIF
jgi:hypothetical protein